MTADTYSLRVTVDAALQKDFEELKALLSHKIPNGDLTAVVREAVQCALEKHRKRRGAVEPARKRKSPVAAKPAKKTASGRQPIPAAVRREVWKRDQGRCTWCGPEGQRCGSTWQVELDHIRPAALGDPARSRTCGSSADPIMPCPPSTPSGGRTWSCSVGRRP